MVFADAVEFPTEILHGRLHMGQDMFLKIDFELLSTFFHALPTFP